MYQRELSFSEAIDYALKNHYCRFVGRASASEFWWFALFYVMAVSITMFISGVLGRHVALALGLLVSLSLALPLVSLMVRRLHDVGHSGWWLLLWFTGIGVFVLLFWFLKSSDMYTNEYGPVPNMVG